MADATTQDMNVDEPRGTAEAIPAPGTGECHKAWTSHPERLGAAFAFSAYVWWGFVPIYFKLVASVTAFEVLAHRILWSAVLTLAILAWRHRGRTLQHVMSSRSTFLWLICSSLCIALNWLVFIWSVGHGYILETSLGYFINPLISVLFGVVLLGERLRRLQMVAVSLASLGVFSAVFVYGAFPWIALTLACSFGLYGLLRKRIPVDAVIGLFAETALLVPIAVAYLVFLVARGECGFTSDGRTALLLLLAGPVTTIPLIFFVAGVRRISLTALGFLQYVSPTLTFLLAVFVYGEPFSTSRLVTFAFIWAALLVFSLDTLRRAPQVTELP